MTSSTTPSITPSESFGIHPVAGRIGAEVRGVRLSGDLATGTYEALRQALYRYKVLFFRGQDHLDDAGQEAFARRWGDPVAHPTVPVRQGAQFLFELDSHHGGRVNSWHTDVSFDVAPPQASILRAVTVPPHGGDTVWANTATAFDELPAPLKALAQTLWAVHGNDYDYTATRPEPLDEGTQHYRKVFTSTLYETEHPVVRVHPGTGERTLLLGHFVKRLSGFNSHDSAHLLAALQFHVTRLENTVRWRWAAADVAIWDNRATQHYAINDYGDQRRVMRRATVAGEAPVSVDGQASRALHKVVQGEDAANAAQASEARAA